MTAVAERQGAAGETVARFRAAMEAGDHAALVALFAPDIVFKSPIAPLHFHGREAVSDVFATILVTLEDVRYFAEGESSGLKLLAFSATVRGRQVQAADFIRVDERGQITERMVMIRPLSGLAVLTAAISAPIARNRGRVHGWIAALLVPSLPVLLRVFDWWTPRLIRLRSM